MCNLNSNGDTTIKRLNLGCVFLVESKTGFVISYHTDSSLPKNGRSDKGSFTMTKACPRALHGKKKNNNKLILAAKTRRKSNVNYV